MQRSRTIIADTQYGGAACDHTAELRSCKLATCVVDYDFVVDQSAQQASFSAKSFGPATIPVVVVVLVAAVGAVVAAIVVFAVRRRRAVATEDLYSNMM